MVIALLQYFKTKSNTKIQFVCSHVHDMEGLGSLCVRAVCESGYKGEVTYVKGRFHLDEKDQHNHEEMFRIAKGSEYPFEWSSMVEVTEDWAVLIFAPFRFQKETSFANAGLVFQALGHNFVTSKKADGKPFGPEDVHVSMNNIVSYEGKGEGGRFFLKEMQQFFDSFPIMKDAQSFALRDSLRFIGKQLAKELARQLQDDSCESSKDDSVSALMAKHDMTSVKVTEESDFIKKWTQTFANMIEGNRLNFLALLNQDIFPKLLEGKALPYFDENGIFYNPTKTYFDRILFQLTYGIQLECTDLQHMMVLWKLWSKFVPGYFKENEKTQRVEFFPKEDSNKGLMAMGLTCEEVLLLLQELVPTSPKRAREEFEPCLQDARRTIGLKVVIS